jgi:hypothetical protein
MDDGEDHEAEKSVAKAERFIRTLTHEEVYLFEHADMTEARARIGDLLEEVYHCQRLHSAPFYR